MASALVGVPMLFATFVAIVYRVSPTAMDSGLGSALLFAVLGSATVLGGVVISRSSWAGSRPRERITSAVLYCLAMAPTLFIVGFSVACLTTDVCL
jgi:hypothetical protein